MMIVPLINLFSHSPISEYFVEKFSSWTQEHFFFSEVMVVFCSNNKNDSTNYHIENTP